MQLSGGAEPTPALVVPGGPLEGCPLTVAPVLPRVGVPAGWDGHSQGLLPLPPQALWLSCPRTSRDPGFFRLTAPPSSGAGARSAGGGGAVSAQLPVHLPRRSGWRGCRLLTLLGQHGVGTGGWGGPACSPCPEVAGPLPADPGASGRGRRPGSPRATLPTAGARAAGLTAR